MDEFINYERYKEQYKLLNIVLDLLKKHNIFYVAIGGTQLGLHRDKCILPYDDDFDFLIIENDKKKLIDLMIDNNFNIHHYDFGNLGEGFKIEYKNSDFFNNKYAFIDIFVANNKNGYLVSCVDKVKCNKDCVLTKSFDNIPHINIMCNEHVENYLDNKYENWKNQYIIWNHHVKEKKLYLNKKDVPNLLTISNNILNNLNM